MTVLFCDLVELVCDWLRSDQLDHIPAMASIVMDAIPHTQRRAKRQKVAR